jgi:molybdopterin biosynthesis enzyme
VKDTGAGWDDLAALMDMAHFRRTAADGVAMDWPAYRDLLLTASAPPGFRKQINRISEAGNRVFTELTEYETIADGTEKVVHICTVHAFDDSDRLVSLDIYTQG